MMKTTYPLLISLLLATAPALAANVSGVVEHSDGTKVSQPGGTGTKIVVDINTPTAGTNTSHNTLRCVQCAYLRC